MEYAIRHIRHVVDTYDLKGISIADELFNSDTGWVYDFCDAVEAEFKGDLFIRILGARVTNVDRKMLQRLWDVGCYEINYGQESGSASILKGYRKGATIEQNEEVTNLSNEVGFLTPLQLVIGSPMETTRTIMETIGFMGRISALKSHTSINYLIPLPETPIWKHVMDNNMIPDVEAYLERVAQYGGMFSLGMNLTKAPRLLWILWWVLLYRAARMIEARERGRTLTTSAKPCSSESHGSTSASAPPGLRISLRACSHPLVAQPAEAPYVLSAPPPSATRNRLVHRRYLDYT